MKNSIFSKCLAAVLVTALMGSATAHAAPANLDELLEQTRNIREVGYSAVDILSSDTNGLAQGGAAVRAVGRGRGGCDRGRLVRPRRAAAS